ncbi:DsbA family oxidoreductase [Pseudaestuariivita atlantica]|uniref:Polyketide biosynthesis protein n=1 Tax=Pseudaestuariivita atlantica TaxID=1317121 RepID=A0A0L1JMI3_9RHOB|nr:DsbA family oxidoreductase [Pseudaestuariivita atlantica]KNG92960.1 polyketide biosynthesis protein [Pseudaestuariivita atlantica]
MTQLVRLDILSDPICPWCYIGKTHLDRALAEAAAPVFEIQWHPFQLNPDMPPEGMDRRAYLEAKFGGKERAVEVYGQIAEAAEDAGLMLNLGAIERTPNTLDAHRLIHWSGLEGKQGEIVAALFRAYFEEGRDIGDREVLADIADGVGMDAAVVLKLLASDTDIDDIRARDAKGREMGVTGVPCFIVGGQHAVPGAQPPDLWAKVIEEIRANTPAPAA